MSLASPSLLAHPSLEGPASNSPHVCLHASPALPVWRDQSFPCRLFGLMPWRLLLIMQRHCCLLLLAAMHAEGFMLVQV